MSLTVALGFLSFGAASIQKGRRTLAWVLLVVSALSFALAVYVYRAAHLFDRGVPSLVGPAN